MKNKYRCRVAAVHSPSHDALVLRAAFRELLDHLDLPLASLIKPGERVLLKPFLHYGRHSHPAGRLVSHPTLVACVLEALIDCGAHITLGDEGSKHLRNADLAPERQWLHALARRTGTQLVSFAKAGARRTRSGLHFPRSYLISRAVLDVDHVVNCANFQAHNVLGMSGAVKNMFNAVVGQCQQNLHELFTDPADLARVMVDVCGIVKPTISFLDLTSVPDRLNDGVLHPFGLLLAGHDPVALDAVAAHAVGWDSASLPTLAWGEKQGVGCADIEQIALSGLTWSTLPGMRLTPAATVGCAPERLYVKTTRLLNKTLLRPRPTIMAHACNGCGDCETICPVQAVKPTRGDTYTIALRTCADCRICIAACDSDAIRLEYVGLARGVRRALGRSLVPGQVHAGAAQLAQDRPQ